MSLSRIRAVLGVSRYKIPALLARAEAIYNGMTTFKVDYPSPNPPLPAFEALVQNLSSAQQVVQARTRGAAEARNVQRDLLWSAMGTECSYIQSLVDASPSRGASLIQNAGFVVATINLYHKPLLALTLGTQPGTINCVANVSLLVGTGTLKPYQKRFLCWQYTLDGGKTFVSAPPTAGCKTVIADLPALTVVGVRVSVTDMREAGAWSQVVTILVH